MKMDRKAMIGFPMRLAVAFLILSISVPVISGMVLNLQNDNVVHSVSNEAEKVSDAISKTYYYGIGGKCTVDISIQNDCYLKIGGEGSESYTIGIFQNDTEKGRIYLQRPTIHIFGDGLDVSGNRTLSVECIKLNGEYGVKVTILD